MSRWRVFVCCILVSLDGMFWQTTISDRIFVLRNSESTSLWWQFAAERSNYSQTRWPFRGNVNAVFLAIFTEQMGSWPQCLRGWIWPKWAPWSTPHLSQCDMIVKCLRKQQGSTLLVASDGNPQRSVGSLNITVVMTSLGRSRRTVLNNQDLKKVFKYFAII